MGEADRKGPGCAGCRPPGAARGGRAEGPPRIPRPPLESALPFSFQRLRFVAAPAVLLACLLGAPGIARADEADEVAQLLQSGRAVEALRLVDQRLAKRPDDVQLRFLRGVALAEQNRVSEAIAVFNKLVQDHPELPEPYNNLAVLYANQGQFDRARSALETAIRTNPSYATAHENLGDLYAKLASQAYSKALQLDAGNSRAAPKLAMIRELISLKGPQAPAAVAREPEVAALPSVAVAPAAPVALPVQPAIAPAAEAEKPVAAAPAAPEATADDARAEVRRAVEAWAEAWSRKDLKAYFAAYTPNFSADGMKRAAWESSRRERITSKKSIRIGLDDWRIEVRGKQATASFQQDYRADTFSANSRKTLKLVRQGGQWRIERESTGS
ncbi:tetratricopeptide repeat protein [Piscinibacter sp. Jin2]|uniref:Tetratricopeptide repeat protein n=1 Tax=Aquariibacter lacus TaxID=2801332 RepID=A0A9X0XCE4_9BURK|nr:tetratricopeptide repeat protein [Piscinibacter lacus]